MIKQNKSSLTGKAAIVRAEGKRLLFAVPNQTCQWRVDTLFSKEPATVDWLRRLDKDDILLDIGANVGMYTVFAAAARGARVYAFEPESQSYSTLCKNIRINNLQKRVVPYCAALSDRIALDQLYLSEFSWDGGSSCHSLGEEVGFDLQPRTSGFTQGVISYTVDQAVKEGMLPIPAFIKIDVDGFEHKVIAGAMDTLRNPTVRTICIEINQNLSEHQEIIENLRRLGFYYDPEQVEHSTRKQGAFSGCAEYIFDRFSESDLTVDYSFSNSTPLGCQIKATIDVSTDIAWGSGPAFDSVIKKIEGSEVVTDPFPCIYLNNLFPDSYYDKIQSLFPSSQAMHSLGDTGRVSKGAYSERNVLLFEESDFNRLDRLQRDFWLEFASCLYSERFIGSVIEKFKPWCSSRLAALRDRHGKARVSSDALLVSDRTDYAIGPHTDLPHRLLSFLFYWPKDDRLKMLGTSFYKHKDPDFICPGGPHYDFQDFIRLGSAPFLPNSLLVFVRTGRSFHGVEPIKEQGVERRLLINNVRLLDV